MTANSSLESTYSPSLGTSSIISPRMTRAPAFSRGYAFGSGGNGAVSVARLSRRGKTPCSLRARAAREDFRKPGAGGAFVAIADFLFLKEQIYV